MNEAPITILCSGFGLGFYNPGLIISYQLRQKQIPTEVFVFESFVQQEKQDKILDSKKAYHDNFSLALVATKIPKDIRDSIDFDQVDLLLEAWAQEGRHHFIALSGHWVYILDLYRAKLKEGHHPENNEGHPEVKVDLLYVDSDLSPSWKGLKKFNPNYNMPYNDVWLYHSLSSEISCFIPVGEEAVIPLKDRHHRYVIHGGGWGMGTYQGKIPELYEQGFQLDIVAYEWEETLQPKPGARYFMNDPAWTAWRKGPSGEHDLPLFAEIQPSEAPEYTNKESHHGLYDVIRQAKAIVSKPGAGTLMDSLSSGTPVIILEPFGTHEKRNGELWVLKGFGIYYEDWKETGFSEQVLHELHLNLLRQRSITPSYTEVFIENHPLLKQGRSVHADKH
ncbi:UDP-glucuronosyltransferase [Paenibacillus rigui]|uniref:UDP-glucuronosyltransferase n=1 Tax=Paenibacillus rigui TaxID=554312 RepID=A0A229UKE3_9BACL|nr:UDP-glucuronosyltransferase [Paenibacillus rigui]